MNIENITLSDGVLCINGNSYIPENCKNPLMQLVKLWVASGGTIINVDDIEPVKTNEQILAERKAAYKAESDPLYMEWQFDQAAESEQIWRDKVLEIKARYPLN